MDSCCKIANRRLFLLRTLAGACVAAAALGLDGAAVAAPADKAQPKSQTILVLGDSLSAEYGLRRGTGWIKLLGERLANEKIPARMVNASISGETTSGGRARLPALLAEHKSDVVVIELGANDALRGQSLNQTESNLAAMTRAAQATGAEVLLLGMQIPPNYGAAYADQFAALFRAVAKSTGAALLPFFLEGVADAPDAMAWFQPDRIHPNEQAQPTMERNVWPEIRKLLK